MFIWRIVFLAFLLLLQKCLAEEDFDVLSIANVPFPTSSCVYAATFNATYSREIPEFTVCYRYMITFYNDGWFHMFFGKKNDAADDDQKYYWERSGLKTGFEVEGYQLINFYLYRILSDGGLGGMRMPTYISSNLPRNHQNRHLVPSM